MLAKTGIEVHLMHEFMPPGPFLEFQQRTCPIHFFRSKTRVLGCFTQFRCRTGQITKMGYWLHTRLSHYSETFNQAIHTMSFVKRAIAKTSVGCIQGTSLCLRNCFLLFFATNTPNPLLQVQNSCFGQFPPPKLFVVFQQRYQFSQRVGYVDEMARNTSFRCKVRGAKPSGRFRAPKWCENTQNMSFGPKRVH